MKVPAISHNLLIDAVGRALVDLHLRIPIEGMGNVYMDNKLKSVIYKLDEMHELTMDDLDVINNLLLDGYLSHVEFNELFKTQKVASLD